MVGTVRAEVDSLQQQAAGDTLEAWTEAATNIQERGGELLMELDRLNTADIEEARDIREDIASQLAGLEGDVVRRQVECTVGSSFTEVAVALEERLFGLQQTLDSVSMHLQFQRPVEDMEVTPSGEATRESVDAEQIQELRNEMGRTVPSVGGQRTTCAWSPLAARRRRSTRVRTAGD